MKQPYKHRLNEREFLNLPGHHDSAYVVAYVEDTADKELPKDYREETYDPGPRMILEIADCSRRINLEFEIDTAGRRQNSFHKIDTLIASLEGFRDAMAEESTLYKQRERIREAEKAEEEADKKKKE